MDLMIRWRSLVTELHAGSMLAVQRTSMSQVQPGIALRPEHH
jgi:hypothetical protein